MHLKTKIVQTLVLAAATYNCFASVLPRKTSSENAVIPTQQECESKTQTTIVENVLANKDSHDIADACSTKIDVLVAAIVPTSSAPVKTSISAFERDILYTAVTFKTSPVQIVKLYRLRGHKKDGSIIDVKYGSKLLADKAWSEWKTNFVDATDCEAAAEKSVVETKLVTPGYGRLACINAYSRALQKYNPEVTVKKNGVVNWSGTVLNTVIVASVSTRPSKWVVLDGSTVVLEAQVYRVMASSLVDMGRPTWEVAYGRKIDADEAQASLEAAMEKNENKAPSVGLIKQQPLSK